ncbi:hypothetical protein [Ruminococcus sp. FC2018]|uniref:hypothetical protein n=1 Tax=Ruminococcus sp. FC2018 TaxID=1410617 RepID=UPI00048E2B88|nr:hypothetical protein [Ruminococcus sp. FC2018]
MIKNKVLTPVLASVLGVSVIGSGVGYYLVNKDSGETSGPKEKMDSMKISLTQVEKSVNTATDDVQKAVSGQLDYAYDSSLKFTFGEGMNLGGLKTTNSDGKQAIKPIEISTNVKQKGQKSQANIVAKYNDTTLVTLETITSKDNNTAYFRIPELSSAYIQASEADIKKIFEEYQQKLQNRRNITINGQTPSTGNSGTQIKTPDLKDLVPGVPDVSAIDSKKLEEKLKSYLDTFKSKLPAKKDGANVSGDIDGNKYDYKSVIYSINGKQAQDALYAVIDKMAADSDLKKLFDDSMSKQTTTNKKSYADIMAELKKEIAVPAENQNKVASFELYYDGDEISGFGLKYDNKEYAKAILINKDTVNAVDLSVSDDKGTNGLNVKGSSKLVDGTVNGVYTLSVKSNGKEDVSGKLSLDKVVVKDDYFSGTIQLDGNFANSSGKSSNASIKLTGTSEKDKKDIKLSVDTNGKNVVTVEFKMNKTEATDIALPTEKTYKIDQMEEYYKTCDIENFKASLNDAIGYNVFGIFDSFGKLGKNGTTTTAPKTNSSVKTAKTNDYEMFQF